MEESPQLRRGLFGYSSKKVRQVLADRDTSLREASDKAGKAEALMLQLRSEVERSKTVLAEQGERLRAIEAEAAELRSDRDTARRDLDEAAGEAARLRLELTATKHELETVRNESETTRDEHGPLDERLLAAEELSARQSAEIAGLRQELGTVRRHFLIQSQRARNAEARVEELEAEVRSVRAELDSGLSSAIAELEAARATVEEAAARPATDRVGTAEEPSAVAEAPVEITAQDVNRAETDTAEDLREEEPPRPETLAEIEGLAATSDRLAPLVGAVRSTIEDARERAAGISQRVDEAVAPLTEAVGELSDWLAAFTELATLLGEEPREPGSERSLHPVVELDEQDGGSDRPDPAGGVEANSSSERTARP